MPILAATPHPPVMEPEEVQPVAVLGEVDDPGLVSFELQAEVTQEAPERLQRIFGSRAGATHHHESSSGGESHPSALTEGSVPYSVDFRRSFRADELNSI